MAAIISKGTRTHPHVVLDRESGTYRISGISIPEDAFAFYSPIIDWLKTNMASLPEGSVFSFCLTYFNSSSLKALYMALLEIKKSLDSGKELEVRWYVEEDDEFMQEAGETFAEMTGISFTYVNGSLEDEQGTVA